MLTSSSKFAATGLPAGGAIANNDCLPKGGHDTAASANSECQNEYTIRRRTTPSPRQCRSRNQGEYQVVRVHARTGKSALPTNRHIPLAWALLPERDDLRLFTQFPGKRGKRIAVFEPVTRSVVVANYPE